MVHFLGANYIKFLQVTRAETSERRKQKFVFSTKLTPAIVFILCSAFCASKAAFRVKNVTKQHPEKQKSY